MEVPVLKATPKSVPWGVTLQNTRAAGLGMPLHSNIFFLKFKSIQKFTGFFGGGKSKANGLWGYLDKYITVSHVLAWPLAECPWVLQVSTFAFCQVMDGGAYRVHYPFSNLITTHMSSPPMRMPCPPHMCTWVLLISYRIFLTFHRLVCYALNLQTESSVHCSCPRSWRASHAFPRPIRFQAASLATWYLVWTIMMTLGVIQVSSRSWSFPWDWEDPLLTAKPRAGCMGKIIEPGIGMELSCNPRLLERILGDFLSQWVADFFFFFF